MGDEGIAGVLSLIGVKVNTQDIVLLIIMLKSSIVSKSTLLLPCSS
jgi:hypothetical protein